MKYLSPRPLEAQTQMSCRQGRYWFCRRTLEFNVCIGIVNTVYPMNFQLRHSDSNCRQEVWVFPISVLCRMIFFIRFPVQKIIKADRHCDKPVNRSQQRLCKLLMPSEKGQRFAKRVGRKPSLTSRILLRCASKNLPSFFLGLQLSPTHLGNKWANLTPKSYSFVQFPCFWLALPPSCHIIECNILLSR